MNASPAKLVVPPEGRDLSLWLSVLGAPLLYLCHHELNYVLVVWACAHGNTWVLTVVSVLFLSLLLGSAAVAWRDYRRAPGAPDDLSSELSLNRHRLLSVLGLMATGVFFLLVLAQWLATLILNPCME